MIAPQSPAGTASRCSSSAIEVSWSAREHSPAKSLAAGAVGPTLLSAVVLSVGPTLLSAVVLSVVVRATSERFARVFLPSHVDDEESATNERTFLRARASFLSREPMSQSTARDRIPATDRESLQTGQATPRGGCRFEPYDLRSGHPRGDSGQEDRRSWNLCGFSISCDFA
jgi:hypothetical protein